VRLGTEYGDVVEIRRQLDEFFNTTDAGHTIADDDEFLLFHKLPFSSEIDLRWLEQTLCHAIKGGISTLLDPHLPESSLGMHQRRSLPSGKRTNHVRRRSTVIL
jgi:hypothetical protein